MSVRATIYIVAMLTQSYDIVPPVDWRRTTDQSWKATMETKTMEYMAALSVLGKAHGMYSALDPNNIAHTKWPVSLLGDIARASHPLYKIYGKLGTKTADWLLYWELYACCLCDVLKSKLTTGSQFARVYALRSFHIDNTGVSISVMDHITTNARMNWKWAAPFDSSSQHIYDKNITKMTAVNMRAWRNKIALSLETSDIIVGCIEQCDVETVIIEMLFALVSLDIGGTAVIHMPIITSTMLPAMYLFAQFFTDVSIVHTTAKDHMYLCGSKLLRQPDSSLRKTIDTYCNNISDSAGLLLTEECMGSESFAATSELVIESIESIRRWRIRGYEKILKVYNEQTRGANRGLWGNYTMDYLATKFVDHSDDWAAAVKFDYLSL